MELVPMNLNGLSTNVSQWYLYQYISMELVPMYLNGISTNVFQWN